MVFFFWLICRPLWGGDRIDMLIERIEKPETTEAALDSRHRKPS